MDAFSRFIGAGVIAILVYFLAWKNGVSPIRLVLIGIGLSALMQALTTLMMILGPIYRVKSGEYLAYRNRKWVYLGSCFY